MKIEVFEGKTEEEALDIALNELKLTEQDIIYKTTEQKGKLFRGTTYQINVVKLTEILDYLKKELSELLTNLGTEAKFETSIRDKQLNIRIFSEMNNLLIGRNGQNLAAIQTFLRQVIYKEIKMYPYILLDVENYKENKINSLERNAKKIAREVMKTKIEAKLDPMNSYERRIVHNALAKFEYIETASEGEEPNRYVVIKYKEIDD